MSHEEHLMNSEYKRSIATPIIKQNVRTWRSFMNNQTWTRWQNWVNVVLGIILFVSPWYTVTWRYSTSSWNAWILGVLIVIMALAAAAAPRYPVTSWINIFLGLWVFISPWLLGFTLLTGMDWTAWIIGALVFLIAIWAVSQASSSAGYSGSTI